MTSSRVAWPVSTSYIDFCSDRRSRNVMDELACGSRSMSRTVRPRMARAAARLIAVVVFPTPPFWFAIAMTVNGASPGECVADATCRDVRGSREDRSRSKGGTPPVGRVLHLVFAEVLVGQVLQPLLEPSDIDVLVRRVDAASARDDVFLDEDA